MLTEHNYYDIHNTEFKNVTMQLADIKACEPDGPDSKDFFQEIDIGHNFLQGGEPLLPDHEPEDFIPLGSEWDGEIG